MPLEFDPADNDDYAMQQLDKRDSTAMAGVAWYHHERWGTVKASAAADVLDNSNGWVGGAIDFPQNADRSPVADTCAGRALL